jgi:2,4-dienoyl-CoA reductase-like NADH-dependent reductase (Old Yellow Enzyme family)
MTESAPQGPAYPATPTGSDDVIFTPLKFNNLEVKNRIFRSSVSGRFDNEDGSLTQTRINWECKFAKGGIGAIISSYVPVLMEGRIIAGYATIHRDDFIASTANSSCSCRTRVGKWTCPVYTTMRGRHCPRPAKRSRCTDFCAVR